MTSQRGNDSNERRNNQPQRRSDRPRGFPPPPGSTAPQTPHPDTRDFQTDSGASQGRQSEGGPSQSGLSQSGSSYSGEQREIPGRPAQEYRGDLSQHPGFPPPNSQPPNSQPPNSQPPGPQEPASPYQGSHAPNSPNRGAPQSGYIPPGYADSQPPYSSNQHAPDSWQADARFAPQQQHPPQQRLQPHPSYPAGDPRGPSVDPNFPGEVGPAYDNVAPRLQANQPPYGQAPGFETAAQPYTPPHPRSTRPSGAQPEEPARRSSIGKTILKIMGWTLLLSAILIGLVVGGGWLTLRNAANQFLDPNTTTTVITKAPVVASLKKVSKQIVIEHNNMVDVDYSEAPEGWLSILPIEQSFVVLLRGRVPAGFDLTELNDDDVWISNDGSKIQLVLPPPVIFEDNVAVNLDESRIVTEGDTCPNFICAQDLDVIQQVILPQGRQLLIETSRESGIMEQAAEMGVAYYESLLRSLGFEEIQVFIRTELGVEQVGSEQLGGNENSGE